MDILVELLAAGFIDAADRQCDLEDFTDELVHLVDQMVRIGGVGGGDSAEGHQKV
jgi:hypothetical protein